jgi:hypothetical protein
LPAEGEQLAGERRGLFPGHADQIDICPDRIDGLQVGQQHRAVAEDDGE